MPRFEQENFRRNKGLVEKIRAIAAKGLHAGAQLALAWVLAQEDDIIPIPGTKRRQYLEENVGALDIRLTPKELMEIDSLIPPGGAAAWPMRSQMRAVMMNKHEAIKFLQARLATIEQEHHDELASEDSRSEADARAEAKALAALYDFLKECKISRSAKYHIGNHSFAFSNVTCAESRAPDEALLFSARHRGKHWTELGDYQTAGGGSASSLT